MKLWKKKIFDTILLIINYPDIFIKKIIISIKQLNPNISKKFSNDDLSDICDLLNVNLNLIESLIIIKSKNNSIIINEIIKRSNNGEFQNEIMKDYLKKDLKNNYEIFVDYLTFNSSILLSLEIKGIKESLLKDIFSELLYPLVLLIISLIGMLMFSSFGFNTIVNVLSTFDYDFTSLIIVNNLIKILTFLIFIIIVVFVGLFIYSNVSKNRTLIYVIICNLFKHNIYQEYVSNTFIRYFIECVKLGLKTKESLELLSKINNPLIQLECYHIDKSLREGENMLKTIDNIYLDEKLARFFKIAMYSNDLNIILNKYIIFSNNRFKRLCKKYSRIILVFSYGFIAFIIIFIYQILFVPLTIMSEI
jgi:type II secretory pathway component PulF